MSDERPPASKAVATVVNRRPGRRRLLPKLLLACTVGLVTLKIADVAVGVFTGTQQRHRLRLAPRAELRHQSKEFDYVFRTNRLGLRGPEISFTKPAKTYRIAILGDSFIAGYGVAEEHLLTGLLQQQLQESAKKTRPNIEVVNVGRVGTSTIRELDLYESLGRRFQPDVVILAYYLGNDLAEVVQEQTDDELARWSPPGRLRGLTYRCFPNLYLELAMIRQSQRQLREFTHRDESEIAADIRQEALARQRNPDDAAQRFESLPPEIRHDVATGVLSEQRVVDSCIEPDRLLRALDPSDADFERSWSRTQTHLDKLQSAVARDGAQLVLVLIPAPFQLDRQSLEFHRQLGYEVREAWLTEPVRTAQALSDWSRDHDIPCLDLTDELRKSEKPLYFIEDVHFNPEGNHLAAMLISQFLLSRKLCP
ncbi:MAG: SGNH/GDSL hydrolase family protein [Planctomycetes bacterium]|nr:SGNH/GDSL hydrolase family protein [Planctomycetota bacterium]